MEGTGRNVLEIKEGNYRQMGIWAYHKGYQITIALKEVKKLCLCLYDKKTKQNKYEIHLPLEYRRGRLYSYYIAGIDLADYFYQFVVDGKVYMDPYARAITGREVYGQPHKATQIFGKIYQEEYEWENDTFPELQTYEMFMYKLHVRGFTKHRNSKVKHKGTFLGVTEKIPYIKMQFFSLPCSKCSQFFCILTKQNRCPQCISLDFPVFRKQAAPQIRQGFC